MCHSPGLHFWDKLSTVVVVIDQAHFPTTVTAWLLDIEIKIEQLGDEETFLLELLDDKIIDTSGP